MNKLFLVYGEDGLTFWALTEKLDEILDKLGDSCESLEQTPQKTLLLFYSFYREFALFSGKKRRWRYDLSSRRP